ncbi:helix-turn-helix domain-containing protein [Pasteurella multocida]|uniref:transcriptional regulator n=1 Tax=Pasteurella TaxID=745 RepID=UPI000352AF49|nr:MULTISPECIES: helix-turn-helix domain-containing protein [Pasteurella]AUK49435.1 Cro/Cl family transcriptional regulator [Pasteurella multocida]AUK54044.1 Cro/Cl family transcriptional regulator [Pasteurella multocida]EPE67440.1 hypothetical protein I141_08793 [Pasteurella multocida P1933]ESQ72104.1 transcriptional regulator [Pasteurella multocida subsp. multocida P1062]MCL7838614.1 helix-turn-helix domain-containing protein [Pasteurella multocida]
MSGIKRVIKICGNQKSLASICGVSQQAVNKWAKGGKMDVKYIPAIIKATNGKVTAEEIRPDVDWAVIKGVN